MIAPGNSRFHCPRSLPAARAQINLPMHYSVARLSSEQEKETEEKETQTIVSRVIVEFLAGDCNKTVKRAFQKKDWTLFRQRGVIN